MIAKLLRLALNQRFVSVVLALALVGLGIWAFTQLSIEAYPDISDTQVVVITVYPGHAAEDMEQHVSIPIERALNSVPQVIARRSRTIFGLSVVELTFEYGTNDYFARQVVLEKLRSAELPEGVSPTLGPLSTPIGELYRYTLEADGYDAQQLREIEDWIVEPRLLQVPGVTDITPFGGTIKQYQIAVDPMALTKYGLSIKDIALAVDSNNEDAGGAVIDNRQQGLVVRGVGLIQSISDIENVVVTANGGVPVFVRDIGRVLVGPAPRTGIFAVDDRTDRVEGIVLMRRGENPSQVLAGIHAAVDELNGTTLPRGVRIAPIYDRTDLVNNTLHTVTRTLIEGLLIVLAVLFLFLGSVRAAFLTAITIPLSLLFAFACMHYSGIPANLLSLGAIDFGIIVDGTLVMVEHVVHTLSHRQPEAGETALDIIRDAALEVERPIFFSLLIIVAAYIPLFTLERVERRLFTPMAFTVCYALIGSMLIALTIVPVLATYLFRHAPKTWENPVLKWLYVQYERGLEWSIRYPKRVVAIAAVVVAAAGLIATRLGSEFLPQLDEGVLWIRANFPAGISLEKSASLASAIRTIVRRSPEASTVTSQTGRNDDGTDPYGPNRNEFFVALTPYGTWPHGKRKADLVDELSIRLRENIPGAFFSFTQPIIDNVTEAVTGSPADLAVIISGPNLEELRRLATQTLDALRPVRGAADTGIEQEEDQAQLRIRIDREAVARYGINVRDVEEVIELAIGGRTVSTFFEGERRFDISVRYTPEARTDPTTIGTILVATRDGGRVPLSQLADIRVSNGASIIARRENRRQISVRTNIRGRDQGGFVQEAQERFAHAVALPEGYRVEWGGQFENLARARRRLAFILPVTVLVIFALLFFTFGSVPQAGLVLLNVPFSLVGGILALYLRGINLSVSAAVGFISLFGVAVMSGVLVISEINSRLADHRVATRDAVVQGALAKMRPVLMMVVVAMLGMVPAALATGVGSDVQRPLATVVVGGLLSTLVLTLMALPALYWLIVCRSENAHERTSEGPADLRQ
jgi:cobalt-zinc-cadmium resistance protein CzcA